MWTARLVAGEDRRTWLDAMEAELEHMPARRVDWALGSLVAAIKDRIARDWTYAAALAALPTAALAAIPLMQLVSFALRSATGLSALQLTPLTTVSPLPFALLLGAVAHRRRPLLAGALAFAVYQAIPAIGFSLLFGTYVYVRWEMNLSFYGLLPPYGLALTAGLWIAGAWLGARWARNRRRTA